MRKRKAKNWKRGIYISYRPDTGDLIARMLYDRLRVEKGYKCFVNIMFLGTQDIRQKLKLDMSACDIFILVLSQNALDRCGHPDDILRQEIEAAKEMDLTFIPVRTSDFTWPEIMPEGLEYIKDINAIPFDYVHFEAFFKRLCKFIENTRSGKLTWKKKLELVFNVLLLVGIIATLGWALAKGLPHRSASAPAETAAKPETVIQETKEETKAETKAETKEEPSAADKQYLPHKWGDYSPSGTAFIETLDGTRYTAIANSLILKTDEVESSHNERLYEGLDDLVNDENPDESDLIRFAEMESVTRNGDRLDIVGIHGPATSLELLEEGEILFIGEKDTGTPASVLEKDIRSITFDRSSTPPTEIKYCTVRLDSGFYRSPAAFLWFNVFISARQGYPTMSLGQDLSIYAEVPLPIGKMQELIVTKNGNGADYYVITEDDPHPEQTEMTVRLTTGEEVNIITGHYFSIYTMAADGALRQPSVRELRSIEME